MPLCIVASSPNLSLASSQISSMPTTSLQPPRARSAVLLDELSDLLCSVNAPVVLLRELVAGCDPNVDDIDLLLTPECRERLILSAMDAATAGRFSFRITQRDDAKMRLTLHAPSGSKRLHVDLWSEFTQSPRRYGQRYAVSAQAILATSTLSDSSLRGAKRCDPELDCCLLLLHLAARRKPVRYPATQARLIQCAERLEARCVESACADNEVAGRLAVVCRRVMDRGLVDTDVVQFAAACVVDRVGEPHVCRRSFVARLRSLWLRWSNSVAVVGSDGSGKSSLISAACKLAPDRWRPHVAKKLYRRSWFYQAAGSVVRRVLRISRNELDDQFAPLLTLRAALSLWLRQAVNGLAGGMRKRTGRRKRRVLLDRSVASCLITNRTSDNPRRVCSWLERLLPPVTTVLLTLPHSLLFTRKQEQRHSHGHARYERLLLLQSLSQRPTDLIVLAPESTCEDSAALFHSLLGTDPRTLARPVACSAAAAVEHLHVGQSFPVSVFVQSVG